MKEDGMSKSREEVAEDIARGLFKAAIIGFDSVAGVREIVLKCLPTRKAGKKAGSNES
jgi:hypothetical protein